MSHEIETMAYFGQTPWHSLGTVLEEADQYDWQRTCAKAGRIGKKNSPRL